MIARWRGLADTLGTRHRAGDGGDLAHEAVKLKSTGELPSWLSSRFVYF
jgi:hypothetical protein